MSNQNNEGTSSANKRPTHIAYSVKDRGDNQKGTWQRIGAAWSHADGNGINVVLDLMPFDGRITLRLAEDNAA